ncbi:hypothetical protein [Planktothrix mougeotii]|uniref:Uncharacterized protein n=1 Tax=Planktothrix mougeotii LEGE 06226 TaxID=1828728 RepID=A0ABR9UEM7_9CYAN|nr:hypothetical protein [Planktothrix mougeotii]MBE9144912.1 hypothetical protein [Planktothrix mougeotii LEGE 06226]
MNQIDYGNPNGLSRQDLIILKLSVIGCGGLLLIGLLVFAIASFKTVVKADPKEQIKPGDGRRELTTPTRPSEAPAIITKKPQKPIIVEEGSEAWFCLQNNGGDGCLSRDRFAPNYKIVSPPKPQKTYEDYLVQYGVRNGGDCGRYLNGKPNCI